MPPKLSLANGFVIDEFPNTLMCKDAGDNVKEIKIDPEEDINDVMRAILS